LTSDAFRLGDEGYSSPISLPSRDFCDLVDGMT